MNTNKAPTTNQEPRAIARFIPLLQWAPHYERRWLRPDLIAGLTVTALVVPKALAPDLERALLTIRVSRAVLIEKPEAQQ